MRQHLGVSIPILAALAVIMGSVAACSKLETTPQASPQDTGIPTASTPAMDRKATLLKEAFASIEVGDTMRTLIERLGPPTLNHPAQGDQRLWHYERIQISSGAAIVTFTGLITLNAQGVVTNVQQTKP